MKVLVTGATGFVGSHLLKELSDHKIEVIALARNLEKWEQKKEEFDLNISVLNKSLGELKKDDLPQDLDAVIHTAGLVHSFEKKFFFEVNTELTENFFKILKEKYSKLHFIFISSLAALGPLDDKGHYLERPVSDYGVSKLKAEEFLKDKKPENWKLNIVRPPMVIGPGDTAVVDIYKTVKLPLWPITGFLGKKTPYSFISVFDLVSFCLEILNSEKVPFLTHPAFPETPTFNELMQQISKQLKVSPKKTLKVPPLLLKFSGQLNRSLSKLGFSPPNLSPDKVYELCAAGWICPNDTNFSYKWDLKRTLEVTIDDYKERGWI